jgi:hypothetical protein
MGLVACQMTLEAGDVVGGTSDRMKGYLVALVIPVGLVILVIGIFWLKFL